MNISLPRRRAALVAGLLSSLLLAVPMLAQDSTAEAAAEATPDIVASRTPVPGGCEQSQVNVITTTGMIADVVSQVGGSCVTVTAMMGPGVDPHLYSATPEDVDLLFGADVIFYNGLNLEARMTDVLEQVEGGLGIPVIPVGDAIPADQIMLHGESQSPDPHVWMDISMWEYVAGAIRDGLSEYLPDYATYFAATTDAYLEDMQATDAYVAEQIARIPEAQRILVTAHDAFQYYSRRYGIEVFAPQGITTQAEVGVADIRNTIDVIVERQVPTIFVETSVSPDVIEAIVAGAQERGLDVQIGGSLFSDAMGNAGTPEGTYLGMIRANTDTIVRGLLGETAEGS